MQMWVGGNSLAIYVDKQLCGGLCQLDKRRMGRELDCVIVGIWYLSDREVFDAYYKNHIAKWLLRNKSGFRDA